VLEKSLLYIYTSELSQYPEFVSSEFEFGELKRWGVAGRLSGIVFGEEVRN
jgi:hypothetical protein